MKQQVAAVLDDEFLAFGALAGMPPHPFIAVFQRIAGRPPGQQGYPLAVAHHRLPQEIPGRLGRPKVVQVAHGFVEERVFGLRHNDGFKLVATAARRAVRLLPFGICSLHPSYGNRWRRIFLAGNQTVWVQAVGEF